MPKKIMKKAQMNQVFMYIIAAITFALIAIFGYRAIAGFLESGEKVEYVHFKDSLESEVKKIYTDYGALRQQEFYVPGDHTKICFVNMNREPSDLEAEELCREDQIACSFWETAKDSADVDQNVFLTPSSPVPLNVFSIGLCKDDNGCSTRESESGFLCIPIKDGSFTIFLEGKGDRAVISKP